MLRHFYPGPGDRRSAMTTSPRVVKLSTAQVRQPLKMKSQAPEVEFVTKVSAKEKKNAEPITEDKKAARKNDEKKSPAGQKVKMRKRKQREKVANLSDQLTKEQKLPKVKKQHMVVIDQRQRACFERGAEQEKEKQHLEDPRQPMDLDHVEEKRSGRRLQTQRREDSQNKGKGLSSERSSWVASSPSTRP